MMKNKFEIQKTAVVSNASASLAKAADFFAFAEVARKRIGCLDVITSMKSMIKAAIPLRPEEKALYELCKYAVGKGATEIVFEMPSLTPDGLLPVQKTRNGEPLYTFIPKGSENCS